MDTKTILAGVTSALSVASTVAGMLSGAGFAVPAALDLGVKIATGVAGEIPEAVALFDQFNSGTIPTQAELDAYAAVEDGAYAKLMADIAAAEAGAS